MTAITNTNIPLHYNSLLEGIDNSFDRSSEESNLDNKQVFFRSLDEKLMQFRIKIRESGMMVEQLATPFYLTLAIANELIGDDGSFNCGKISLILEYLDDPQFFPGENSPPCLNQIRQMLDRLQTNNELVDAINEIGEWNNNAPARCRLLITSTLGIPHNSEITPAMLKKVVLKSLFDHLRQVETNDCQGEWAPISFLKHRPQYVLRDFLWLIMVGYTSRIYNSKLVTMSFTPYLACNTLKDPVKIDTSGAVYPSGSESSKTMIWTSLPIQAALLQMDLPFDDEELNNSVLGKLFQENQDQFIEVSPLKIISTYASCVKTDLKEVEELAEKGCVGYGALRNSFLQKSLIDAYLYACQYTQGPSPVHWVVNCVSKTFENQASNFYSEGMINRLYKYVTGTQSTCEKIINLVANKLKSITSVQYEQRTVLFSEGNDEIYYGQNAVYQKNEDDPIDSLGKRVNSQTEFQKLVQDAIANAEKEINSSNDRISVKNMYLEILNKMNQYVETSEFVDSTCQIFSSYYGTPASKPYEKSQNIPWRFFEEPLGRSSVWVYLNQEKPDPSIANRIKGAMGIDKVVDWWMEKVANISSLKVDPKENPYGYNGTVLSDWFVHSFNWKLDHPTLLNLIDYMQKNACSWQDAFDVLVVNPGNEIAETALFGSKTIINGLKKVIEKATKSTLKSMDLVSNQETGVGANIDYREYLKRLNDTVASRIDLDVLEKEVSNISEIKNLTFYQGCQLLIQKLNELYNSDGNPLVSAVIECLVSTVAINSLSEENYKTLSQSAIHIADNNWTTYHESQPWPRDSHFCFLQDPATKKRTIAMLTDDNQDIMILPLTTNIGGYCLNLDTVPEPKNFFWETIPKS